MATNQYEAPAFGTRGSDLLSWLLEAVGEGQGWLEAQQPSVEWASVLEMLNPQNPSQDLKGQSNVGYSLVERNARDIVASLSNFRHEGEFKPRFNKALYKQAHVLTHLDKNWYTETHAHVGIRANLQNAVVFGTGYILEDWQKDFWGSHGDIRLTPYEPSDVTFVQLPKSHDIQQAYAVIIRDEMPINLAKATYKNIASQLVPDRDKPGWMAKGLQAVQRLMGGSPALRAAGTRRQQQGSFPTVDIFHMYILDRSINMGPVPVEMGASGTNWTYRVPALGDPMPMGIINPATGAEFTRPAEEDDCKLFPLRRYSVFSRTGVAYDGSSPWWHGQVPLARMRFNDWAWQALGKSLLSDARTMQDGIVALMRYIEDASCARLDPALLIDEQLASDGFSKTFNPRKAGARAMVNLQAGDVMKTALPVEHYDVPTGIYDWIKQQENRINHQMGTPDLVAIAKAKQVPGAGTLEKLLEMAGPLVQDMMRSLEVPQHQLGEWRKAYYFQFYTQGRLINTTGPDDGPESEFEFTPDLIVPAVEGESLASKKERTRRYLSEFKYHLTESGINEMHRLANKLALLQLKKVIPVDRWTIAEAWKLPNYGPKPEGTNNVMERVIAEAHMDRELAEELGGGQVGNATKGRPPSNQKSPQMTTKGPEGRPVVKTS